ncbi:MAG: SDR family oxidoreductase [Anaerolineales bacterium]|nr:SDR family oxidoreductase [Anaerolineales bacterium]
MRILITGASGLLGINLALVTTDQHTVFGQVNSNVIHTDAFTVLKADLLDSNAVERLLDETQPDWVIHCAALANVDACEKDPGLARELNTEVPRKLAKLCREGGARLLHVSTDAVFDGRIGGYTEEDAPNPLSTYAQTKLHAEYAVAEANPEAIIARVNLFGWSLKGRRSLAEFFYNNLSAGNKVMGFGDVYFSPLLVNDIAHIFIKMLETKLKGLYHVLSSDFLSKYDFGIAIAKRFGLDENLITPKSVSEAGLTAARSPNLTLKVDKLIRDLGDFPPTVSTGIDRFYTLYQQGYPQALRKMADHS